MEEVGDEMAVAAVDTVNVFAPGEDPRTKEFLMAENAELRNQLASRDVQLAEKEAELKKMTNSFQGQIAVRNFKIKQLEDKLLQIEGGISGNLAKNVSVERSLRSKKMQIDDFSDTKIISKANQFTRGTIRASFHISDLYLAFSSSRRVAGVNWAISVGTINRGPNKYLSAYLNVTSKTIPADWKCNVAYTMKLIQQRINLPHFSDEVKEFNSKTVSGGFNEFILLENVLNPFAGYIKNKSIILEVDFKVYPQKK